MYSYMCVLNICQVSILQAAPTPSCWMPSAYEEVCDHSMFVTHFDTTSNTIAIEEISHFAYIFCYRAHIKENKKKWRLP